MRNTDVVIVGAGPVGLFLACELLRAGHSCLIVERNQTPSTHSKALALMPRTLQLFESAQIVERFLREVNRVSGVRFVTPRRATYVSFAGLPIAYPFVSIVPQWKTEGLLAARVVELGGCILYGHTFERLEQHASGIRAIIGTASGAYTIEARFLAGCDGVHSTVREQASIAFAGRSYAEHAVLADVPVQTDVPLDEARVHIWRSGVLTLFPISAHMRRIVVVAPHERLPQFASRTWLQERIARAHLHNTIAGDPVWTTNFRVHRRVARRLRAGHVFLAGDSAHAHSPVGGQGMNTGLFDAWALARTLSGVLAGETPDAALETYEAQRLRVARSVVRRTDLLMQALVHPNPVMCVGRELLTPYVARIPLLRERIVRRLLTA